MRSTFTRARRALRIFAPRACVVASAEAIGPDLRRVRFAGDELRALAPISPGQQVSVLVEGAWPVGGRNYSIAASASDASWVEIIAHLHGAGAGARAFARFEPGDRAKIWGPGGGFVFPQDGLQRVYLGDESALGTFLSVLAHEPTSVAWLSVEAGESARAVGAIDPRLFAVERGGHDPHSHRRDSQLLEAVRGTLSERQVRYIIAGRTRSCHQLRLALLEAGVPAKRISVRAFWTDRS